MSKSDGHYKWPSLELIDTDFRAGTVTLEFRNRDRHFRITSGYFHIAKKLVDVAHEIVEKYRTYAMGKWDDYKSLKIMTGYRNPNDKE